MSLLVAQLDIYDITKSHFQRIPAVIDTGATQSLIPRQRLLDLGYDLTNVDWIVTQTANEGVAMLSLTVAKITALGQTADNIKVSCYRTEPDVFNPLAHIGLLGMNFLSLFDNLNISFSKNKITLT